MHEAAAFWWRYTRAMAWQSSVVLLIVGMLYVLCRKRSAAFRHCLLCLALVKLLLPPGLYSSVGFGHWLGRAHERITEERFVAARSHLASEPLVPDLLVMATRTNRIGATRPAWPSAPPPSARSERPAGHGHRTILFGAWLAISMLFALGIAVRAWRMLGWLRQATPVRDPRIVALLGECRRELGIRRGVRLAVLPGPISPMLHGVVHPTIVIPRTLTFKPQLLRPALLHELAHLRRADPLVNVLQVVLQVLWFFHPGVWLANRLIRRDREEACDDVVLGSPCIEAKDYARCILDVLRGDTRHCRMLPGLLAVAQSFRRARARIVRILDTRRVLAARLGLCGIVTLAALGTFLLPTATTQAPGKPKQRADSERCPQVRAALEAFSAHKRAQAAAIAAERAVALPADFETVFDNALTLDAAATGAPPDRVVHWPGWREIAGLAEPATTSVLRQTVLETWQTAAEFEAWGSNSLLLTYAENILGCLPENSIYLGGSDPGRFVIGAFNELRGAPRVTVIGPSALSDPAYLAYLRETCRADVRLPELADIAQARKQTAGLAATARALAIHDRIGRQFFEHNKHRYAFFVEEGHVADWMYPYLMPHGPILKMSPTPLAELPPERVAEDMRFWHTYCSRLLDDPRFAACPAARHAFAKLRTAIAGVYAHHGLHKQAETAFLQARKLAPLAPEIALRLARLRADNGRVQDAEQGLRSFLERFRTSAAQLEHPRLGTPQEQRRYRHTALAAVRRLLRNLKQTTG